MSKINKIQYHPENRTFGLKVCQTVPTIPQSGFLTLVGDPLVASSTSFYSVYVTSSIDIFSPNRKKKLILISSRDLFPNSWMSQKKMADLRHSSLFSDIFSFIHLHDLSISSSFYERYIFDF